MGWKCGVCSYKFRKSGRSPKCVFHLSTWKVCRSANVQVRRTWQQRDIVATLHTKEWPICLDTGAAAAGTVLAIRDWHFTDSSETKCWQVLCCWGTVHNVSYTSEVVFTCYESLPLSWRITRKELDMFQFWKWSPCLFVVPSVSQLCWFI
jgi:hypothetical protein